MADRISANIRAVNTAARIGGDEFLVVLPGVKAPGDAACLAARLIAALSQEMEVEGTNGGIGGTITATIGASIGIALYPTHGETCDVLMQQADQAMYAVKRAGKNNFRFVSS